MSRESFKVHPALKSIIGKDLIHSDFVAIIELIKNSKDADASDVQIYFKNETSHKDSRIEIVDNGYGMSIDNIRNNWLSIAYSEKKKLTNKRYAGNKGVGRFSCDRLGTSLELITRSLPNSNNEKAKVLHLYIDWLKFEKALDIQEISDIKLNLREISDQELEDKFGFIDFHHGTILRINNLRATWPTAKLRKLFTELEKFSPSLDDSFRIYVFTNNKNKEIQEKQGKPIYNNLLEKISFKTTYIKSYIDDRGKRIHTTMYYQGEELLNYSVQNPYPHLKNINTEIHYVDAIARAYFTRLLKVRLVHYGSIFLFYNDFRVSPYGDPGNDWLGLDQRKSQGTARYLGARELCGRIDIEDENQTFHVLSNREGLAYNKAFQELIENKRDSLVETEGKNDYGYITNIIRQLESFVVGVLEWNKILDLQEHNSKKPISELDLLKNPTRYEIKEISAENVETIKSKLLKSNWNIKRINVNHVLINEIATLSKEKYRQFLIDFIDEIGDEEFKNILRNEIDGNNLALGLNHIATTEVEEELEVTKKALNEKTEALKIAQKTIAEQKENVVKEQQKTEQAESENLFLRATSNKDSDALLNLMHKITDDALTLDRNFKYYIKKRNKGTSLSDEEVDKILQVAEIYTQSILKVTQFATLRNYKMSTGLTTINIIQFISDYISLLNKENLLNGKIKIIDKLPVEISCIKKLRPLNLTIMIDNIINNSIKANATELQIYAHEDKDTIILSFEDNGDGLAKNAEIEHVFKKGYTFTNGSGLGLYFVKNFLIDELNAHVTAKSLETGFIIEVEISCN